MSLIEPKILKNELLALSGVSSTNFNNWRLRGIIPFDELGCKRESLTRFRYSVLTAAYCKAMTYHTGQKRGRYVRELKNLFIDISKQTDFNEHVVIAISGWGQGKDCGVFDSLANAMILCPRQCSYVPVGQIIKNYIGEINHVK